MENSKRRRAETAKRLPGNLPEFLHEPGYLLYSALPDPVMMRPLEATFQNANFPDRFPISAPEF